MPYENSSLNFSVQVEPILLSGDFLLKSSLRVRKGCRRTHGDKNVCWAKAIGRENATVLCLAEIHVGLALVYRLAEN